MQRIYLFSYLKSEALAWQAKDWMDSFPVEINVALNADQGKFYHASYKLSSQNIETYPRQYMLLRGVRKDS